MIRQNSVFRPTELLLMVYNLTKECYQVHNIISLLNVMMNLKHMES